MAPIPIQMPAAKYAAALAQFTLSIVTSVPVSLCFLEDRVRMVVVFVKYLPFLVCSPLQFLGALELLLVSGQ